MAYLLRTLILLVLVGLVTVILSAHGYVLTENYNHLGLAIPFFIFTIFVQAFVMFYFIGVSRFTKNIYEIVYTENKIEDLFDEKPEDLKPYIEKSRKFVFDTDTFKRQTIPWTMLILTLGTIAFLLGGAHDTNLVDKHIHSGVAYGFFGANIIGFFRQWIYLKKAHILLRKIKTLFTLPDGQM